MIQERLRPATTTGDLNFGLSSNPPFADCNAKNFFDRAATAAGVGIWVCDLKTESLSWTPSVYGLFDLAVGSMVHRRDIVQLYDEESQRHLADVRARAISTCEGFALNARIATALGATRWIAISGNVDRENGEAVRLFGLKRDITHEITQLDHWRRLAQEDPLTGLANRAAFQALLHDGKNGARAKGIGALVLVDLDNFKQLNDGFGHLAGDTCLIEVARRLRAMTSAHLIARIGGDEFAVVFNYACDPTAVETAVREVLASFNRPIRWGARKLHLSASVGIAFQHAPTPSGAAALYARADRALYDAKGAGRNQCYVSRSAKPALGQASAQGR